MVTSMRIANWRAKEVLNAISEVAIHEANIIMSDVVVDAKNKCPVLKNLAQERPGGWQQAGVSFTPKSGKNKGTAVSFSARRWTGRQQGDLQNTIRRVEKDDRPGNIRVYAGNFKIYYAHMIEKTGYHDRAGKFHPPVPFLRNSFNVQRPKVTQRIKFRINDKITQVG